MAAAWREVVAGCARRWACARCDALGLTAARSRGDEEELGRSQPQPCRPSSKARPPSAASLPPPRRGARRGAAGKARSSNPCPGWRNSKGLPGWGRVAAVVSPLGDSCVPERSAGRCLCLARTRPDGFLSCEVTAGRRTGGVWRSSCWDCGLSRGVYCSSSVSMSSGRETLSFSIPAPSETVR